MNFTEIAFKYRKSVLMVLALLLINGAFAYFTLPWVECLHFFLSISEWKDVDKHADGGLLKFANQLFWKDLNLINVSDLG